MKHSAALLLMMATIWFVLSTSYVCAVSLDDEAKKVVADYLTSKKLGIICGDSYYSSTVIDDVPDVSFINQYKEFSFYVKPQQVTHADKMNGVEWKGSGGVSDKTYRFYIERHGWSKWIVEDQEVILTLVKEKGKWVVDIFNEEVKNAYKGEKLINCQQIEALPK